MSTYPQTPDAAPEGAAPSAEAVTPPVVPTVPPEGPPPLPENLPEAQPASAAAEQPVVQTAPPSETQPVVIASQSAAAPAQPEFTAEQHPTNEDFHPEPATPKAVLNYAEPVETEWVVGQDVPDKA